MVSELRSCLPMKMERDTLARFRERIKKFDVIIVMVRELLDDMCKGDSHTTCGSNMTREIFSRPTEYEAMRDLEERILPHFHRMGSTWK